MANKWIGVLIVLAAGAAGCGGSSSGGAPTAAGSPPPASATSSTPTDGGCATAATAGPVFGHWLSNAGAALHNGNAKAAVADLAKASAPIRRAQRQTTGDLSAALGRLGDDIDAFAQLVRHHRTGAQSAAEDTIGQDVSTIKGLCP